MCDVITEHGYALCFRLGPHGANKSEDLMKVLFFKMWNFFRLTGEVFSFFLVNLPFFLLIFTFSSLIKLFIYFSNKFAKLFSDKLEFFPSTFAVSFLLILSFSTHKFRTLS